jgi:hypothetical protein
VRQQVAAAYRGANDFTNEAAPLVAEYVQRMRMAKLGYQSDTKALSAFKGAAFSLIAEEIAKLQDADLKKKTRANG